MLPAFVAVVAPSSLAARVLLVVQAAVQTSPESTMDKHSTATASVQDPIRTRMLSSLPLLQPHP